MNWWCLGTRVTPAEIHSATIVEWCSAPMTATTTCGHMPIAQYGMVADSGTTIAYTVEWTLSAPVVGSSAGMVCLEVGQCSPLACRCSANSEHIIVQTKRWTVPLIELIANTVLRTVRDTLSWWHIISFSISLQYSKAHVLDRKMCTRGVLL